MAGPTLDRLAEHSGMRRALRLAAGTAGNRYEAHNRALKALRLVHHMEEAHRRLPLQDRGREPLSSIATRMDGAARARVAHAAGAHAPSPETWEEVVVPLLREREAAASRAEAYAGGQRPPPPYTGVRWAGKVHRTRSLDAGTAASCGRVVPRVGAQPAVWRHARGTDEACLDCRAAEEREEAGC